MNSIEFGMACRELNRAYRDAFGVVPVPSEYVCTRDQFLEALKKSLEEHNPIETYLDKRVHPVDGRLE